MTNSSYLPWVQVILHCIVQTINMLGILTADMMISVIHYAPATVNLMHLMTVKLIDCLT